MDKKTKTESFPSSPLRTPKPKNKLGLKVPQIRMPHEQIIRANDNGDGNEEAKPELKIISGGKDEVSGNKISEPLTLSSLTRQTSQTRQSALSSETEVAPTKNFQKVANSITKQAVPEGWFKGKSKQLYDALYSLTRGAIVPVRKTRVQKGKLMKLSGIGSRITFDSNIKHLITMGLIKSTIVAGEHGGNEFEVFLPEEITLTSQTSVTSLTSSAQKLDTLVSLETSQTSQSSQPINTGVTSASKTLFKTLSFIDDDAPIINVLEKLNEAARKLTGKDLLKRDLEKLADLTELLISETLIAAARTGSVSSTIAFMTENLRRRLYSKPRAVLKKESKPLHLNVGKGSEKGESESDDFAANDAQTPMNEEQRQNTLAALREAKAANTVFFREFKIYGEIEYTAEDFKWLMENLEK